eukprot:2790279-Amphidinium_carterae.2
MLAYRGLVLTTYDLASIPIEIAWNLPMNNQGIPLWLDEPQTELFNSVLRVRVELFQEYSYAQMIPVTFWGQTSRQYHSHTAGTLDVRFRVVLARLQQKSYCMYHAWMRDEAELVVTSEQRIDKQKRRTVGNRALDKPKLKVVHLSLTCRDAGRKVQTIQKKAVPETYAKAGRLLQWFRALENPIRVKVRGCLSVNFGLSFRQSCVRGASDPVVIFDGLELLMVVSMLVLHEAFSAQAN